MSGQHVHLRVMVDIAGMFRLYSVRFHGDMFRRIVYCYRQPTFHFVDTSKTRTDMYRVYLYLEPKLDCMAWENLANNSLDLLSRLTLPTTDTAYEGILRMR